MHRALSVIPFFLLVLLFFSFCLSFSFLPPSLSLSLSKFLCDYKHCMVISAKLICTTTVNWLQQLINVLEIWHQNKKKFFFSSNKRQKFKKRDGQTERQIECAWIPLLPQYKSKNITLLFPNYRVLQTFFVSITLNSLVSDLSVIPYSSF